MAKTLLIDGSNLYHRSWWVSQNAPSRPNFIFVFLRALHAYAVTFNTGRIILCWDRRNAGDINKRKEELEEYKAQRPKQKEIYDSFPRLKEITEYLGVIHMFPKNFEADDILWYLATQKYPGKSVIITRDTDLYQVIGSKYNVDFYEPGKKIMIDNQYLKEKFDVDNGDEFIIRKALKGDSSDNIGGIYRIQKSRIQNIINWLKDKDIESCPYLDDEQKEIFKRNLSLMKLDRILNEQEEIEYYENQFQQNTSKQDFKKFKCACQEEKFNSILAKFHNWTSTFKSVDLSDLVNINLISLIENN